MKTNKIYFTAFVLLLLVCSCTQEATIQQVSESERISVSDYSYIGEWHNAFLKNIHETFPDFNNSEKEMPTKSETINMLLNINKEFAKKTSMAEYSIQDIEESFDACSLYVETEKLAEVCISKTPIKHVTKACGNIDADMNLMDMITLLQSKNMISDFGVDLLKKLTNTLTKNYNKQITDASLKKEVEAMILLFDDRSYSKDSEEGKMIATVFAISIASIEWWEKKPNILSDDSKVAPWVAADLAGALVGGVTGAIVSGKLNGKSVLAGAVSGSTGAVGKVAKLISKIL